MHQLHNAHHFLLMSRVSCVLVVQILAMLGCSKPVVNKTMPIQAGPHSFLALGDSYTIGENVDEDERWPVQLVKALRSKGLTIDDPTFVAHTGWRTDQLLSALKIFPYIGPFQLVTLQIGVNDQYGKRTAEDYRPRFVQLLQQAITLAGGKADHVLVLSIPDYDYGPFRKFAPPNIGETIDQFNAVCKEESKKLGAVYFDVTTLSRQAKKNETLQAEDKIHFSGAMYALWVEAMLPQVTEMLK